MTRKQTDILISGGGVAGLAAACSFGAAGFDVICVDPTPPITEESNADRDLRTTAFLQPARDLLDEAGLWSRLAGEAMPLQTMRIVDASAPDGSARTTRDFNASDIGELPFGWNLRNWVLRREMLARIAELPNVDFRPGVGFASTLPREDSNIVTLTDGTQIEARLLVGADGRNSPVRDALGTRTRTTRYGQKALSFAVTHPDPHDNISTEVHRSGGPFTLVPLPDHKGQPCSAVVWMTDGDEATRLATLDDADFAAAATARSAGVNGPLTPVTHRQVWPIISRIATRMHGPRTALMAEAAHVVPPIGAQGLNMSLADLGTLRDLALKHRAALGSREMLTAYHRARYPDIVARVAGVTALNRMSQAGNPLLQSARSTGMRLLHDITPIRRGLMKLGLGLR